MIAEISEIRSDNPKGRSMIWVMLNFRSRLRDGAPQPTRTHPHHSARNEKRATKSQGRPLSCLSTLYIPIATLKQRE